MCRHLHLRKFNSGTEYGDLWACLDCPDVFLEPVTEGVEPKGMDVFHNEIKIEERRECVPA